MNWQNVWYQVDLWVSNFFRLFERLVESTETIAGAIKELREEDDAQT